jgi:hypothetical protein
MVRSVEPEQLERLLKTRHRGRIWLIVALIADVAVAALLISVDAALPVGLCVTAGLGVGRLINGPYLRLLKELGLTRQEGMLILVAEQERRSGRAALAPRIRAHREQLASLAYLACGLVAAVVFVVAAFYFFSKANKTVDENAPADVWFAVSAVAGSVSLILAPALLWMGRLHRNNAAAWRVAAIP